MLDWLGNFFTQYGDLLAEGTAGTLIMVTVSTLIAYLFGTLIAVVTTITSPGSLKPQPVINAVLGWIINMGRSIPFIILMVVLIPFTRIIVGTSLGVPGAIVPLTIGAIPFVARMVESSFSEILPGCIEAAQAFGANTLQIIYKVFFRESLPSLIRGATITYITLIGYSAMAGAVGAGGLGDIAIRFGYYRYQTDVLIATVIIIVVLVQVIQSVADLIARKIDKR
ncbi:methionine ABC transporter permease [Actinomycetota bacterium]|nr:methionine ABC transporter permease [Actinomycetota bacterium]